MPGGLCLVSRGARDAPISSERRWNRFLFSRPMCFVALVTDVGAEIPRLRVDGGASMNNLLMQHQADVLGIPCGPGANH